MKKLLIILGVLCTLAIGGGIYSYANVPQNCSTVSGARVYATLNPSGAIVVHLDNHSGSRCSASYTVEGRTSDGKWEVIQQGIISADNGKTQQEWINYKDRGYTTARLVNVSTWKCE